MKDVSRKETLVTKTRASDSEILAPVGPSSRQMFINGSVTFRLSGRRTQLTEYPTHGSSEAASDILQFFLQDIQFLFA